MFIAPDREENKDRLNLPDPFFQKKQKLFQLLHKKKKDKTRNKRKNKKLEDVPKFTNGLVQKKTEKQTVAPLQPWNTTNRMKTNPRENFR